MLIHASNFNPNVTLSSQGWIVLESVIPNPLIERLRLELESAYSVCREIQIRNGIGKETPGTLHHLVAFKGAFLQLLEQLPCRDLTHDYFAGPFILNSFGGVLNSAENGSYVGQVHRDVRFFTGDLPLMLNMLIMLDDFTVENGATHVLSGSHRKPEKPDDDYFFEKADRVCGKAGSCLLFNSNLWHAAGVNRTSLPRRALTLTWTRSCIKQQLDYVRLLGETSVAAMDDSLKQLLGYYSRTPSTLEEWYLPPERRFYRPAQD
jgi:hypothetical protein